MNLREKLAAGERIYGTMLRLLRNPAVMALAQGAGLHFVLCDCEHSSYSMETLHDLFLTGRALGVAGLVRVPAASKEHISRALDCGAAGVMAPMVETAEDARQIVRWAKYPPLGERGYAGAMAHVDYHTGQNHTQVMRSANESVLAIAQIETALAIENCDEIAAVDGLDALVIGPNDLSLSLGIPGELAHPLELDAIAKAAAAAKRHGKAFGIHGPLALVERFRGDVRFMMVSTDTDLLSSAFSGLRQDCAARGL